MRYPYLCDKCHIEFDVVKHHSEMKTPEFCTQCGEEARRIIVAPAGIHGASDWNTQHYNPAFGKVMKSDKEAQKEARRRGWVEMGTEDVGKVDKQLAEERKRKASWDTVTNDLRSLGSISG